MSPVELWIVSGFVAALVFFAVVAAALYLDNRKLRRASLKKRIVTVRRDNIPLPHAPGNSGPQGGSAGPADSSGSSGSSAPSVASEPFKPPELSSYPPPPVAPRIPGYAAQARRPAPDGDDELTFKDEHATSELSALLRQATTDPPPVALPRDDAAERTAHLNNPAARAAPGSAAKARTGTWLGLGIFGSGKASQPPPAHTSTPPPSGAAEPPRRRGLFDTLNDEEEEVTRLMTNDGKPVQPAGGAHTKDGTLVSFLAPPLPDDGEKWG